MKKIIVSLVILGLLAAGAAYVVASGSPTVEAQLHVENGVVTLNGTAVTGNVQLSRGDIIRTTAGRATVILHESLLISLEPDTQITLDDLLLAHPQVSQQSGRTWNTFTRLSGMESYSIKAGSSVATVRGTEFEFADGLLVVAEGTVEYTFNGRTYTVTAGRAVENGVERAASVAELARIRGYRLRSVAELRYLRQLELDKHPLLVSMAKQMYFQDESRLTQAMDDADNGRIDVDAQVAKAPARPASLLKIAAITKAIQKILHE